MIQNIQIIFNYDGDIQLVKDEFTNITLIKIPEMIDGTYLCLVENADDFDVFDEFMNAIGTIEVISGWKFQLINGRYKEGKQYSAKKYKNKYSKTKYKKYLRDKFVKWVDEDGQGELVLDEKTGKMVDKKIKVTKTTWQVMRVYGWDDREL